MGAHLLRVRLKTSINTGHGERGAVQGISIRTGSYVVVAVRMRRMYTIVAFLLPVFVVVQIYSYYYYYYYSLLLSLSLFILSFMQRIYIYILEKTVFLENIIVTTTTTTTTTTASLVTVLFSLVLLFLNKL
jgi:hypothetical protein